MTTQQTQPSTALSPRYSKVSDALAEIARLAHTDIPREEFFSRLLIHVVEVLTAAGGAAWLLSADSRQLDLVATSALPADLAQNTVCQPRHAQLVGDALRSGKSAIIDPAPAESNEANADLEAAATGNPLPYVLLLAPLQTPQRPYGVLEIFQSSGSDTQLQPGSFRFLEAMAELAAEYLRNQEFTQLQSRQSEWDQLDRFGHSIHRTIDLTQTAYTLANEARGLIGCDRVTVVVSRRGKSRVAAISGQAVTEHRANVVRLLLTLAQRVIKSGQSLWYDGNMADVPPQIEEPLQAFIDESQTLSLAVIPLVRPRNTDNENEVTPPQPEILGAMVIERIKQQGLSDQFRSRTDQVSRRGAAALANAMDHDRVFLMPLWRTLDKTRWFVEARRLPKTLAAAAVVLAIVVAACVIPADFRISAPGTLQPAERRDVFVQEAGVVSNVRVDHADRVTAGTELIRLRSRELEAQITEVTGRRNSTQELLHAARQSEGNSRLSQEERIKISGQHSQLQKSYESLNAQLKLLQAKHQLLTVRSPIDGQIVTWDAKQRLLDRPVEKGQLLVSVANPNRWELELQLPENHAGYVASAWEAAQADKRPLNVTYILATDPAHRRVGTVTEVQQSAEIRGEEGSTVLVRVKIDPSDLQATQLRPGATVTGQIDCGRQSLGYVWCYDIVAFIRSKILFRF
ncbi:MAG: GAF domain-containing protein [Planctomycetes bacterium]|nr:GAF domain-containing protein [Planctomycetota bacterium]